MKKCKKKMGFGDFLQTVSPLLGLIPGAGMIAAPAANFIGGSIEKAEQEKLMRQQQAMQNAPVQQNSNPYGYAMGGTLEDPPKKKQKVENPYPLSWGSSNTANQLPVSTYADSERTRLQISKAQLKKELEQTGTNYERKKNQSLTTKVIKDKLDKNFYPYDYGSGTMENLARVAKAVLLDKPAFAKEAEINFLNEKSKKDFVAGSKRLPRADAWSLYLGNPQKNNTFSISDFSPTKTQGDSQSTYYNFKNINKQELLDNYFIAEPARLSSNRELLQTNTEDFKNQMEHAIRSQNEEDAKGWSHSFLQQKNQLEKENANILKNKDLTRNSIKHMEPSNSLLSELQNTLGKYTMSRGKDDKGDYISYYDKWDLIGSKGIGKPFDIYDRAYFDSKTGKLTKATGGYLNQMGPNTQEVIGNNPNQTDGVELPQAYVDHGETISNTSQGKYVFSDILKNPITGNSFAQDDKKLAASDKRASAKPYDKEAQNTLMINQKLRDQLSTVNEITKTLSNLNPKGMAKGGYMKKMSYAKGGNPPWDNFNYDDFYNFVGKDTLAQSGFKADSNWGPQHQQLWDTVGPQYQQYAGYNPDKKSFQVPVNSLLDTTEGFSSVNPSTGMYRDTSKEIVTTTDPNTWQVSQTPKWNTVERKYALDPRAMMNPLSNTNPEVGPAALLQSLPQGGLSNTIKARTSPYVDPYAPANLSPETKVYDDTSGISDPPGAGKFLKNNLGTILQGVGFGAQALSVLKPYQKEPVRLNTTPITNRQYDPAQALNRTQSNFNALRQSLGNSVNDSNRNANMLQAYSNKTRAEADIASKYQEMNKQAERDYEMRLAQRMSENNQTKYAVDQMNSQNKAARNNAFRGLAANLAGLGAEVNTQKSNKQSMQWLLSAYPDIAKFFEAEANKSKTKKGGRYGLQ